MAQSVLKRLKELIIFPIVSSFYRNIKRRPYMLDKYGERIHFRPGTHVDGGQNMTIGKEFHSGRGLWMATYDMYGSGAQIQHFKPRLIIGDYVSFQEFVHIGCVNHIEIGNHVLLAVRFILQITIMASIVGNSPIVLTCLRLLDR